MSSPIDLHVLAQLEDEGDGAYRGRERRGVASETRDGRREHLSCRPGCIPAPNTTHSWPTVNPGCEDGDGSIEQSPAEVGRRIAAGKRFKGLPCALSACYQR